MAQRYYYYYYYYTTHIFPNASGQNYLAPNVKLLQFLKTLFTSDGVVYN